MRHSKRTSKLYLKQEVPGLAKGVCSRRTYIQAADTSRQMSNDRKEEEEQQKRKEHDGKRDVRITKPGASVTALNQTSVLQSLRSDGPLIYHSSYGYLLAALR